MGGVQRRRVIDPVTEVATECPVRWSARTMRSFCSGSTSAKSAMWGATCQSASSSSLASASLVSRDAAVVGSSLGSSLNSRLTVDANGDGEVSRLVRGLGGSARLVFRF